MNTSQPWKDERWMPGVLNKDQMIALIDAGLVQNANKEDIDCDASALDLHLSSECYRMKQGSIKPFDKNYKNIISNPNYATILSPDDKGHFLLEKGYCYVFKIKESLNKEINNTPFYGQATAKSTVGRVDVIARLIVDGMKEYETFDPEKIDSGEMFLEITSITFNIKVRENDSLSQLRLFYGKIEDSTITDENFINTVLLSDGSNKGTLSVNLCNEGFNNDNPRAAYQAKECTKPLKLWVKMENDKYNPNEFWEQVPSIEDKNENLKSLVIKKDKFYILRSYERIKLNDSTCIYCRAMDETLGEMRIHYAGFVQPCFGEKRTDELIGTPLIFEVRGHNVDILLTDKEILARLHFYRMSKAGLYKQTDYGSQELTLSKIFKKNWS